MTLNSLQSNLKQEKYSYIQSLRPNNKFFLKIQDKNHKKKKENIILQLIQK